MIVGLKTPTVEDFVTLRAIWIMPPMEKVRPKINKQRNASYCIHIDTDSEPEEFN